MPHTTHEIALRDRTHSVSARVNVVRNAPFVVLTHALSSGINGEFERNLERALHSSGFSTLFFNSYGGREKSRALADMSLRNHVDDLSDVINMVTSTYAPRRTLLVGHSLGGLVALLRGEADIDAMVLCDPSDGPGLAEELMSHHVSTNANRYHCRWDEENAELTVHRSLVEELQTADGHTAASRLTVPLLVLSAGRGVLIETGRGYASRAGGVQEILQDSEHAFERPRDAQLIAKAISDFAMRLGGVSLEK